MAQRDMTPDELERFEEEELHHRKEINDPSGPASEPDIKDKERPASIPVPPNPD